MNDAELQQLIDREKHSNPMLASMTPESLRMMSGVWANMSDEQLKSSLDMLQNLYGNGSASP